MAKTTFAMYEIYGKQTGANILKTPSDEHNLDEFREIYKEKGADLIFLCLPNNPLGECLDAKDVYKFLDEVDENTLVVLDGAYQEFASYKDGAKAIVPSDVISKYPNVIYLGTFSKAYGLGGMRVGYGIANSALISQLYKLRPPFNISTLSLAAAIAACGDDEFVQESIKLHFEQITRYEEFAKVNNIEYIDSYTNFITYIFADTQNSSHIASELLQKGVIVRDLASYGMNAIRITVGTAKQNDRLFEELIKVL
jgi:histidinol-phosphate aminotransferase